MSSKKKNTSPTVFEFVSLVIASGLSASYIAQRTSLSEDVVLAISKEDMDCKLDEDQQKSFWNLLKESTNRLKGKDTFEDLMLLDTITRIQDRRSVLV